MLLAADTSVAVPLLMRSHSLHSRVAAAVRGWDLRLTGHSLAETYSVLTRLPGDARVTAADACRLIDSSFGEALLPLPESIAGLHRSLGRWGIVGGAVYDALVGLAARDHGVSLATRDERALGTFALLGVATFAVG